MGSSSWCVVGLLACVLVVGGGCAAAPGDTGGVSGSSGGVSGSGGNGGSGGGSGFSGFGGFGGGSGFSGFGGSGGFSGSGNAGIGGDDCGGDDYPSQPRQLDIYIVLDESLSMIPYWVPVTNALNQFFASPQAAGIGVGIHYYAGICDVATYETPVVPIAPLPGNAPALQSSLASRTLMLGTAATPALIGAINHTRARQQAMPDTKQVVLLVGDGAPALCNSTLENAAQAAADGFNGNPSIPVYVLGLGNVGNLDVLAAAGGTGTAILVDPNNSQAIVDAMNAIRGQAAPCDYGIPSTTSTFNPDLVNVQHIVGGNPSLIFGVGTEDRCDPAMGGWYYDNPTTPTRIFTCPATCQSFSNGGDVRVVVGCPTQQPPE